MPRLAVVALLAALGFPGLALAASLALTEGTVAASAAEITACDDGFTIAYATSAGKVTAVTVGDIADPGCEGGQLTVTLTDSSGAVLAGGVPTTIGSDGDTNPNAVTVPLAPTPVAEPVSSVHIAIAGP